MPEEGHKSQYNVWRYLRAPQWGPGDRQAQITPGVASLPARIPVLHPHRSRAAVGAAKAWVGTH